MSAQSLWIRVHLTLVDEKWDVGMVLRTLLLSLSTTLLCALFFYDQPTYAGTADWVINLSTKVVDNCLDYPDSKLKPLIRSSIYFEQGLLEPGPEDKELAKKGAEQEVAIPSTLYENQYSSHFRTIGLRRFKQLMIKPGSTGTIKISTSNSAFKQEEANAAANATCRLFLDLYLNKMPLRSIVVSRDIFDQYIQELQRYGFRTFTVVPGKINSLIFMLSIRSEPAGRQQYMSYGN